MRYSNRITLAHRANRAAMRLVPMWGDQQTYRRMLDYCKVCYAKGYAAGRRQAAKEKA